MVMYDMPWRKNSRSANDFVITAEDNA